MQFKLLIILFLVGITTPIMAQKKTIQTSILINARPAQVWQVLTNFSAYSAWNPFITGIRGECIVGDQIEADISGMTFKPEILVYNKDLEIRWIGKLLFKGLFDGEHIFQLIDNGDSTTLFKQSENFNGILVGMFSKKLDIKTKPGFESMNLALKKRVETLAK